MKTWREGKLACASTRSFFRFGSCTRFGHVGMSVDTPLVRYHSAGSVDFGGTFWHGLFVLFWLGIHLVRFGGVRWHALSTLTLLARYHQGDSSTPRYLSTLACSHHSFGYSFGLASTQLALQLYSSTLACSHHSFSYSFSTVVLGFSTRFKHVGMLTTILSNASFDFLAFSQLVRTIDGILAPILDFGGSLASLPSVRFCSPCITTALARMVDEENVTEVMHRGDFKSPQIHNFVDVVQNKSMFLCKRC